MRSMHFPIKAMVSTKRTDTNEGVRTVVGPREAVVASVVELLVGVAVTASPDLELDAIDVLAILDVEALVTVELDAATFESPLLRVASNAVTENNRSTILVLSLQTFARVPSGLEKKLSLVGRSLGSGEASEGDDESEFGHDK